MPPFDFRLDAALVTLAFASVVFSFLCPRSSRPTFPNGPRLVQPQQPFLRGPLSNLWPNFRFPSYLALLLAFLIPPIHQTLPQQNHNRQEKSDAMPCPFSTAPPWYPNHSSAFCSGSCISQPAAFIIHNQCMCLSAPHTYLTSLTTYPPLPVPAFPPSLSAPSLRDPTQATFVCSCSASSPHSCSRTSIYAHRARLALLPHPEASKHPLRFVAAVFCPCVGPACAERERRHACNMHRRHLDLFTPLTQPTPNIYTTWASTPIHAQSLTSVPHSSPNNHRQKRAGTPSPAPFSPPQSQSKPSVNIAR